MPENRLLRFEVWGEVSPVLHPDTSPEALRALHVAEVEAALARKPGATIAELSEGLTLPAWNVARALESIRQRRAA